MTEPAGTDPDDEAAAVGLPVARITVTRVLTDDGEVIDHVLAQAADGADLGLAEALGMLVLAQHTLVETYDT